MLVPLYKDKDLGWKKIAAEIRTLNGKRMSIGVLGNAPQHPSGVNMADIATWNEFGTKRPDGSVHVPARSFLRSTFDEKLLSYERFMSRNLGSLGTKFSGAQLLELLGMKMTSDIKRTIVKLREPQNAPSTIRQKKSSNPLIDKGRLRQSIDYEVK